MITQTQGSTLLTILLIITLISSLCLNVWRVATSSFDIAITKQEYELHIQSLKGINQWGLDLCKNNFDEISNYLILNKKELVTEIPHFVLNNRSYKAVVTITKKDKNNDLLYLTSKLLNQKKPSMTLRCCIQKIQHESSYLYEVNEWGIHGA